MFISPAYAQAADGAATTAGGGIASFLSLAPLFLVFVVFYFLMIRPQQKRMKALQAMCRSKPTDAGARLADVRCPVVVIEGSLDPDFADPRAEGEKIVADLRPGLGRLTVVDGAGHYPHAQMPDQVMAAALPFLAEVLPRA